MTKIEPHIKNYIDETVDSAVNKSHAKFEESMKHHMAVQREIWQDDFKKVVEMVQDKPSREDVREIVHEEISAELWPIRAEMQMYREELIDHRSRIESLEKTIR